MIAHVWKCTIMDDMTKGTDTIILDHQNKSEISAQKNNYHAIVYVARPWISTFHWD